MKLNDDKRLVETEGLNNEVSSFSIKQSRRAFEILSSNIYADKPLAVIREYSCNALDAHRAVGTPDRPFDVHLPNELEPWLSIRDYGPGLSDKDVTGLFTTYFQSTKDNSNDFTGCLGLGSKSAFAYVDQFTIISRINGWCSTYSAYLNIEGVPEITLISSVESDEPRGLEIYVPVKSNDFRLFASKAEVVYRVFKVKPNIFGTQIDMTPYKTVFSLNDKWRYVGNYGKGSEGVAIQGDVAYPIDPDSFSINQDTKNWNRKYPWKLYLSVLCGVEIMFDIGELNITASREHLNYDKGTQGKILDKLDIIIDEIKEYLLTKYSAVDSVYSAKLLWAEINSYHSPRIVRSIAENMDMKMSVGNVVISNDKFTINPIEEIKSPSPTDPNKINKDYITHVDIETYSQLGNSRLSCDRNYYGRGYLTASSLVNIDIRDIIKSGNDDSINPITEKTIVLINDIPSGKGHKAKLTKRLKFNLAKFDLKVVSITPLPEGDINFALDQLGGYPTNFIIKASELPEPPPVARSTTPRVKSQIRGLMSYSIKGGKFNLNVLDNVDAAKGGYYIALYSGAMVSPKYETSILTTKFSDKNPVPSDLTQYSTFRMDLISRLTNLASDMGDLTFVEAIKNAVVVNYSTRAELAGHTNWKPLMSSLVIPYLENLTKRCGDSHDEVKVLVESCNYDSLLVDFLKGLDRLKTTNNTSKLIATVSGLLDTHNKKLISVLPTLDKEINRRHTDTLVYYDLRGVVSSLMSVLKKYYEFYTPDCNSTTTTPNYLEIFSYMDRYFDEVKLSTIAQEVISKTDWEILSSILHCNRHNDTYETTNLVSYLIKKLDI